MACVVEEAAVTTSEAATASASAAEHPRAVPNTFAGEVQKLACMKTHSVAERLWGNISHAKTPALLCAVA